MAGLLAGTSVRHVFAGRSLCTACWGVRDDPRHWLPPASQAARDRAVAAHEDRKTFALPERTPGMSDDEKPREQILREVGTERAAQDAKWGEQNHPDGTGPEVVWAFTGPAAYVAECATSECQRLFDEGFGSWRDILTEEIAEAYAEADPAKLRAELIQVAAVAAAWVEAIDRRPA